MVVDQKALGANSIREPMVSDFELYAWWVDSGNALNMLEMANTAGNASSPILPRLDESYFTRRLEGH